MRSMPSRGVNPWRRLFVANEFNELQSQRLLAPDFMLLIFLVIVNGFGFENYNQMEVELNREKTGASENYILSFFIVFFILFGVGSINYFIRVTFAQWFPPPYIDFVDLCSMANISIIIFNEELNGYYIHGKSPSGSADVGS
jgi:meckelin